MTACVVHVAAAGDDLDADALAAAPDARFGCLCGPCYGRLGWMLRQTPQLIAHIRAQVTPGVKAAAYGGKVDGTPDPRLPIHEQAVEDADDLFSQLANYMLGFAALLGVTGPYATLPYGGLEAGAQKLPTYAQEQGAAFRAVENLVEWYEKRSLRIIEAADPENIAAWYGDLTEYTDRLFGRYPQVQRKPRRAKPRECPICGEAEVRAVFPVAGPEVRCGHCGYEVPEADMEKYVDWSEG